MSRTEDQSGDWSTWEELLLAFAVNRHGTKSWESIAVEIQNRTSSSLLFTAHNCRQKYLELQHRYTAAGQKSGGPCDEMENGDDAIPWLDQLRKLRVAELRRELQRYDVSIVSLQSKVKRLREERESSLKETGNGDELPDREKAGAKDERGQKNQTDELENRLTSVPRKDSEREYHSFNGSTDGNPEIGTGNGMKRAEERSLKLEHPAEDDSAKPDPAVTGDSPPDEATGEASDNGSTDSFTKGALMSQEPSSVACIGDSADFRESVTESKSGEEGMKDNSDVQSSASLSKKTRKEKAIAGTSSGEEPDPDEAFRLSRRISVESQPLAAFLEIVRSHKHGAVFERRLESQETSRYESVIRQHLDLEMVRAKLADGLYSEGTPEFFRDLLLLFNNAIVFFHASSFQHMAAVELRELVTKEALRSFPNPSLALHQKRPPKSAPEPLSIPFQGSPNLSSPPFVTSTKPLLPLQTVGDEKWGAADHKEPKRSPATLGAAVEVRVTKKRTRDRSSLAARGTRSNVASAGISPPAPMSCLGGIPAAKASAGSDELRQVKSEKKSAAAAASVAVVAKKRSAANFLNRMNGRVSSAAERMLLDSLKGCTMSGNGGSSIGAQAEALKKKGGVGRASSGKRSEGRGSQTGKRTVGRPPKKVTPPPLAPSRRARGVVAEREKDLKAPARKRARR